MIKNNYDDIINLPHPNSKNHHRMDRIDRAAQFAPFAALTGYAESINEAGRLVDKKRELTDEEKENISNRLNFLLENVKNEYEVLIIYFVKDQKKDGGSYQSIRGVVRKFDFGKGIIELDFKRKIYIEDVTTISGNVFDF